jgi:hypothetical protein
MAFYKKNRLKLAQAQEILKEYNAPITLRQLYYQMVARQYIPNNDPAYKSLSRVCVIARDEGSLKEEDFADRLRIIDKPSSWNSLSDYFETVKSAYRKNLWKTQNNYVEIWTEKDALRNVITPITHAYDVPLLIVRGQLSRTAVYEGYSRFLEASEQGKSCHLFYFGDFDPSGIGIYNSLKNRTLKFQNGLLDQDIKVEHIALLESQIEKYNLPFIKANKDDPNYKNFIAKYYDKAVELDALPPDVLMQLVENIILKCIDQTEWNKAKSIEDQELEELERIINEVLN